MREVISLNLLYHHCLHPEFEFGLSTEFDLTQNIYGLFLVESFLQPFLSLLLSFVLV